MAGAIKLEGCIPPGAVWIKRGAWRHPIAFHLPPARHTGASIIQVKEPQHTGSAHEHQDLGRRR